VQRQAITTPDAPGAIGPYSQAIRAGDLLFISGQIPIDPATGTLIQGGIADQTHRVLQNLGAILRAAGASFGQVVKTTVFLADMTYFPAPPPARATVQAARLPRDVKVEIDLIAYLT
jgi:2-iminobutanoate/2-iminopropanoate deaminase